MYNCLMPWNRDLLLSPRFPKAQQPLHPQSHPKDPNNSSRNGFLSPIIPQFVNQISTSCTFVMTLIYGLCNAKPRQARNGFLFSLYNHKHGQIWKLINIRINKWCNYLSRPVGKPSHAFNFRVQCISDQFIYCSVGIYEPGRLNSKLCNP